MGSNADDSPVEDVDHPAGATGGLRIMGDHDYRLACLVQIAQQIQDLPAGRLV